MVVSVTTRLFARLNINPVRASKADIHKQKFERPIKTANSEEQS